MASTVFLLGARYLGNAVKNKRPGSLVVSLGKALNEMFHFYEEDRWHSHLGNGNSQMSVDVPSKI